MGNLAEYHEEFATIEKEIMVGIWNSKRTDRIEMATLPFVDAGEMRRVIYDFYDDVGMGITMMFPSGISVFAIGAYEAHIKLILAKATNT